jgi:hypothetical protein
MPDGEPANSKKRSKNSKDIKTDQKITLPVAGSQPWR